ncbi:MAG: Gfo/Idh/MocA family oxidoreductase [Bifidobacteriaceae bacterium]|jgi:predicted homoserine dehydrogenase-like protein|nr:Gfo/Idh/MocA family oxidoreductase [Bifidobacteriaceae bacterium]
MDLHNQLLERERRGQPIRVGVIGAGRFGAMYLAQAHTTPGLHIVAVADINPERARTALDLAEWPDSELVSTVPQALASRRSLAFVEDANQLFVEGIDVIIEATGNPIAGVAHALKAIAANQHVVMVTVEADPLAGPALRQHARRAGVVYTLAYGDQPAVIWELVDWARTSGFEVVCAGKGMKFLPHYHEMTPDNVWENWEYSKELTDSGQLNPRMYTSFRDGTKAAIEMAAVANAARLAPSDEGLTFTPGSQEEIASICRPRSQGGVLAHSGSVEVMSSVTPDGKWVRHHTQEGVFVVVKATNQYVADCFKDFPGAASPDGQYCALYRPYHFIGLEANISVANAALRGVATGEPVAFCGDAVATAKRDLRAGERLDGEGGYTVWGKLISARASVERDALPVAMAHDVKLIRSVPQGQVVTWQDVQVDESHAQALELRKQTVALLDQGPDQRPGWLPNES